MGAINNCSVADDEFLRLAASRAARAMGRRRVGSPTTAEAMERRTLLSNGSVSGFLFNDVNGDGVQSGAEPGLPGRVIYADLNNNGRLDSGEPSTTTSGSNGAYTLSNVPAAAQVIRQVLPTGWRETVPAGAGGQHVTVTGNGTTANVDFAATATAYLSGTVNNSAGTAPVGQELYLDANNNSTLDPGELTAFTTSGGAYSFTGITPGAYIVRQILAPGTAQMLPASEYGIHVSLSSGQVLIGQNFTDRTITSATISGTVTNGSAPVAGVTIYLDANNNLKLDSGELSTVTLTNGSYSFTSVPAGSYVIRQILPSGVTQTVPAGGYGNHISISNGQSLANENFADTGSTATTPPSTAYLTGMAIGTPGSYGNSGATGAMAFDGALSTYFDAPAASGAWAGLDLGTGKIITSISYAPRSGWAGRMVGGVFQGSDSADFSEGVVTLYSVTATPPTGALTTVAVTTTQAFRYVRYLGPTGGYCDIAEAQFTGSTPLAGVFQSGSVITVNGTNGDDSIDIKTGSEGSTEITVNGVSQTISEEVLQLSLIVNALGGDDTVTYASDDNEFTGGITIAGGDGNDSIGVVLPDAVTISGGSGNDTINVVDAVYSLNIADGDGNDSISTTDPDQNDIGVPPQTSVTVGDGSDTIGIGGSSAVSVVAGNGNDSISLVNDGGTASDLGPDLSVLAGNGNDTVTVSNSELDGSSANITVGDGGDAVSVGDSDALDFVTIAAGNGNDTIVAEAGDGVQVNVGNGSDSVFVGSYPGQTEQDSDDDPVNATITAGNGGDTVSGFAVNATVNTGTGNDLITFAADTLFINGGAGNDTINASSDGDGTTTLLGGAGDDVIRDVDPTGGVGGASINGGDGNDTIYANNGAVDTIDGGTGNDVAYVDIPGNLPGGQGDSVSHVEQTYQAPADVTPLTGTSIGTAGSYGNLGNVGTKTFDGILTNYFDAPTASGSYVALDLGSAQTISEIAFAPRSGFASRMIGGQFQSSTTADFSSGVTTLYTVTAAPPNAVLTTVALQVPATARYVRYLGPAGSYCDVGEVGFYGPLT